MIKRYQIVDNSIILSDSNESPIIVYINPDDSEKETITTTFNIDEHTLSSALDPDEVSRIEFSSERISLIWKRPLNYSAQDNFYFNVASVGCFLFDKHLVIVLTDDIQLTTANTKIVYHVNTLMDVLLLFLSSTVHHYIEHLKVIKRISRELQERINEAMENLHLIQMFNLSESLIYYLDAINSNNIVLGRLRSQAEKINIGSQTIGYLDDLIIENDQCLKQAQIYSTVLSGLMDARGNIVNNNMNVLLKKLTIINVVFLPLNLIASIGGMSEFTMMTEGIDWRISYSLFLVAMVMLGLSTIYVLEKIILSHGNRKKSMKKIKWR